MGFNIKNVFSIDKVEMLNVLGNGISSLSSSSSYNWIEINNILYFVADDGVHGNELWKTDGTEAGTKIVKDIYPGTNSSYPSSLTNVNGILYFSADDGINGQELWKADGTESGTKMVKDIYFGTNGSRPSYPSNLIDVNGVLYFKANNGINGYELWKSDGTEAGTVLIKDIYSGVNDSYPFNLTNVNGVLYFSANNGVSGYELWKSDGTETGTIMVKDIYFGSADSYPDSLINVNGVLYFRASDVMYGHELWKSDGTPEGTVIVKDINLGYDGSNVYSLTNINGTLYFSADDGINGQELWKTDGTEIGTKIVKDIYPGANGSGVSELTNVNGTLYFSATDGIYGYELWKTDGTESGTVMVKYYPADFINAMDLFFDGENFYKYFLIDNGNGTSVYNLYRINPLNGEYSIVMSDSKNISSKIFSINNYLYIEHDSSAYGNEIWKINKNTLQSSIIKDINLKSEGLSANEFKKIGNNVYFINYDRSTNGYYLGKTNSTKNGISIIKKIIDSSNYECYYEPKPITEISNNNFVFLVTDNCSNYGSIWSSDGTEAGTSEIKSGLTFDSSFGEVLLSGALYFRANDGVHGQELWKTDGTEAGTVMVKDIYPGTNSSYPSSLTNVNGLLYFNAIDEINGQELWKSDGTEVGTVIVKDILTGPIGSSPSYLTNVNGVLYFLASSTTYRNELWRSDGTESGTVMVKDMYTGTDSYYSSALTNVNGVLYFITAIYDPIYEIELWKSDGTEAGTEKLINVEDVILTYDKIISCGDFLYLTVYNISSSNNETYSFNLKTKNFKYLSQGSLSNYVVINNEFYYSNNDSLFKIKNDVITPLSNVGDFPFLRDLVSINGVLYFSAINGNGMKLWKYDSKLNKIILIDEVGEKINHYSVNNFGDIYGEIYLFAQTDDYGQQLFSVLNDNYFSVNSYDSNGINVNNKKNTISNDKTNPGYRTKITEDSYYKYLENYHDLTGVCLKVFNK